MNRSELATQLRQRREDKGYSLFQVSRSSGLKPSILSRLENVGEQGYWPNLITIEKIANAMNCYPRLYVIWESRGTPLPEFVERTEQRRKQNHQTQVDFSVDHKISYHSYQRFVKGDIRNLGTLNGIFEKLGAKFFVVYENKEDAL